MNSQNAKRVLITPSRLGILSLLGSVLSVWFLFFINAGFFLLGLIIPFFSIIIAIFGLLSCKNNRKSHKAESRSKFGLIMNLIAVSLGVLISFVVVWLLSFSAGVNLECFGKYIGK